MQKVNKFKMKKNIHVYLKGNKKLANIINKL